MWDPFRPTRLRQQGHCMQGTGRVAHLPVSKQRPTKSRRSWRGFYKFRGWSYTSLHNFLTWSPLALDLCTRESLCVCWDIAQPVPTILQLCWERSSCDCSFSPEGCAKLACGTGPGHPGLFGTSALLCLSHPIPCCLGWWGWMTAARDAQRGFS